MWWDGKKFFKPSKKTWMSIDQLYICNSFWSEKKVLKLINTNERVTKLVKRQSSRICCASVKVKKGDATDRFSHFKLTCILEICVGNCCIDRHGSLVLSYYELLLLFTSDTLPNINLQLRFLQFPWAHYSEKHVCKRKYP